MPGELEHVVRAAAFRGRRGAAVAELGCQLARLRLPALTVAGPLGSVAARADDLPPEEVGDVVKPRIARDLVPAGCGDDLRDVSVHVKPAELVAAHRERVDKALLGETVAGFGPLVVLRHRREVVERLGDPAVLRI